MLGFNSVLISFRLLVHLPSCVLFLAVLFPDHVHVCPPDCQLCTRKLVQCSNLGLKHIPSNLSKSTAVIHLSGNNISCISQSEFRGLHELSVLFLANTSLEYIYPAAFIDLQQLHYLFLDHNQIKQLDPETFHGLSNLLYLNFQNNIIHFLSPELFVDLQALRCLQLQRNYIEALGRNTFTGMVNLHILTLANNMISEISNSTFSDLGNLSYLYLQYNNLTWIPSHSFGALKSLRKLVLSYNPITHVHSFAFKELTNLEYLFLDHAKISSIDYKGFAELSNLKQLMLNDNELSIISADTLPLLGHLRYLQLNSNKIRNISSDAFKNMRSLRVLNLASNSLTELHPKVFLPLVSLVYIWVMENPWNCSCQLLGLRNWIAASFLHVNLRCHSPPSLRGRSLRYITVSELGNCITVTAEADFNVKPSVSDIILSEPPISQTSEGYSTGTTATSNITLTTGGQTVVDKFTDYTEKDHSEITTVIPREVQAELAPVNFTAVDGSSLLVGDATPVSRNAQLSCDDQHPKHNEAFDILLAFFVLACALVLFLLYQVVHLRQKLKMPRNMEEGVLEYYSSFRFARYNIAHPVCTPERDLLGYRVQDQVRMGKQTKHDYQTQVILFEHSVL
ncbi:leucine-rich repeat-containing protein 70 [Protopterus annectens]|uniref:leucine-rich repeat-containing protein 70 n=1 Tax=Protopterus annectens TaxID=7888 RepID=UPI001CFBBBAD|nr:leucine-rich repeat-containing protein 70 [Protopterus annectens]